MATSSRTRVARDERAPRDVHVHQREEFGGLNWGAAFFGWLVAIGVATLLTAILSAAGAAIGSAGFPLGMLIGRIALRWLVARVALRRLLIAALALAFAGFLIYWGVSWPPAAIAGVIVIGLGIAPLYTRYVDVYDAMDRLRDLVDRGVHREIDPSVSTVT